MTPCVLCAPALRPLIAESNSWRLVLNRNQDLLGKCLLATVRHVEPVTGLTPHEWAELQVWIEDCSRMLRSAFAPDHFNYEFLQNTDRHVHLHVIPRYADIRQWNGLEWKDRDYPKHHAVPSRQRCLDENELEGLADFLGKCLRGNMRQ